MNNILWYHIFITIMLITAPLTFLLLFFISAPYGRHNQVNWGPCISSKAGWIVMEIPAVLVILLCFMIKPNQIVSYLFLLLWEIHYIHRALIFPFHLKNPLKPMPIVVIGAGVVFNILNGYINGISLVLIHTYTLAWLIDPRFIIGILLFIAGFIINRYADWILLNLRKPGESKYIIPQHGLYQWVSCPNYLGEIIQWMGWAIATWSLAGFVFLIWTIANLVPRALKHHRWYRETFSDYPKNRRALIPCIL